MQTKRTKVALPFKEIKQWLTDFTDCVQKLDFERGKTMFSVSSWCFGSYAEILNSLDDLVENQWKQIWPNITDFAFNLDKLHCQFSQDYHMACVMAPWVSTGYRLDGMTYNRPGRVTIILIKEPGQNTWLAHHTHYSLNPGTPRLTQKPKNNQQLVFNDILSYHKG